MLIVYLSNFYFELNFMRISTLSKGVSQLEVKVFRLRVQYYTILDLVYLTEWNILALAQDVVL